MPDKIEPFTHAETSVAVALPLIRAALTREISLRRGVYPRWAHEGKNGMTRESAAQGIAALESALRLFDGVTALTTAAERLRYLALSQPDMLGDDVLRAIEFVDVAIAQVDRYKVGRDPEPDSEDGTLEDAQRWRELTKISRIVNNGDHVSISLYVGTPPETGAVYAFGPRDHARALDHAIAFRSSPAKKPAATGADDHANPPLFR